jgi:hypothetical protein
MFARETRVEKSFHILLGIAGIANATGGPPRPTGDWFRSMAGAGGGKAVAVDITMDQPRRYRVCRT